MKVSRDYLKFHDYNLDGLEANKWKWFENSIGALDGTHIPATVAAEDRPRYRNRKGDISTNVLGVCGPDLRFIYVLLGWEGSAGDSRVLRDALHRQNCLRIPNGKYFLVDVGYTNGPGFLAPYRGTRYHLKEWVGNTPQNYKELFNLRHSSARNVIERSFWILKKRWSILRTPYFFDIKTQIRIINACFILHNFIIDEKQSGQYLEAQDLDLLSIVDEELTNQQTKRGTTNGVDEVASVQVTEEWTTFRDTYAIKMFAEYQERRNISYA
ncbi:protein ALP1-like isoform X1 [Vicia villosa]|uniref:protein ALP1-like isoform X1 n=1 Tax=Vicia villosa TaxID=3911 RepID=UPI00273BA5CD|nr:protein ALP1-like isoform X1 [Vicia villosa]XP_058787955.1 protein ALP1-like isoform X1 [Vicia villosa]XP_058787957.1 protein ALP1-like isoform X1 [Vicia villosa]